MVSTLATELRRCPDVYPENANYSSIDGILYNKDVTKLICCPGAKISVTIPNSVTSIGDYAFSRCSSLESVTIPDSVTSIGDYAFSRCSSLASVTIPNSVTSIGNYAFSRCSSLESVTIPNSVTSIGSSPFYGCSKLKNIDVYPENANYSSIDGILYNKDVTKLICCPGAKTSVTIPNSVTSIGDDAFYDCND